MRTPGWEERFAEFVAQAQAREFAWSTFDCCTFAADAVKTLTGVDPMAELRARYHDQRSAVRLLKQLGGLQDAVTKVLGEPLEHLLTAQRGDVVMVKAMLPALGVVVGASALVPLASGMQRVPMGDWLTAWRVD